MKINIPNQCSKSQIKENNDSRIVSENINESISPALKTRLQSWIYITSIKTRFQSNTIYT